MYAAIKVQVQQLKPCRHSILCIAVLLVFQHHNGAISANFVEERDWGNHIPRALPQTAFPLLPAPCPALPCLCPGECEGNAAYMRGDATTLGECRRACGDCEVCRPDDIACKSRNRVRAGYLPLEDI